MKVACQRGQGLKNSNSLRVVKVTRNTCYPFHEVSASDLYFDGKGALLVSRHHRSWRQDVRKPSLYYAAADWLGM